MKTLTETLCPDVELRTGCNMPKLAGDLVRIGNNHGPLYQLIHIEDSMAWVRPVSNGQEGLVPVERLRAA